jgi:S1-C subfamily serine protease
MNKRWVWILIGVVVFFLVLFSGAVAGAGLTYFALQAFPVRAARDVVVETVSQLSDEYEAGVLVQHVDKGSPANEAGIKRGHIILAVDDQQVDSMIEMMDALEDKSAGDSVTFTVQQCETTKDLSVMVEERNGHIYLGLHPSRARIFEMPFFDPGGTIFPLEQPAFVITRVLPDSPADEAGLQPGGMIVAINGDEFQAEDELADIIQALQPGDEITISVVRLGNGDPRQIKVTLGTNPENEDLAYLGIEYRSMPGFGGLGGEGGQFYHFEIPKSEGESYPLPDLPPEFMPFGHEFPHLPEGVEAAVLISSVTPESPAAEAGLEPGDVITEINGESISDLDSFVNTIRSFDPDDEIALTVLRINESEPMEVELTLGEDPETAGQAYLGVSIGGFFRYEYRGPGQDPENPFHFDFRFPWFDRMRPRDRIDPALGEEA